MSDAEAINGMLRHLIGKCAGSTPQTRSFRDLRGIDELRVAIAVVEHELIEEARDAGVSWGNIGGMLNMSKQAAQKRYHRIEL